MRVRATSARHEHTSRFHARVRQAGPVEFDAKRRERMRQVPVAFLSDDMANEDARRAFGGVILVHTNGRERDA